MRAFRKIGYSGVSIKILEAETGLSSGSLYNSFGGKGGLFERALDHYNDTVVDERIRTHLNESNPIGGLVSLFQSLLEEPDGGTYGCLLTNSSIEFAGSDTIASVCIRTGFDRFLAAFKQTLLTLPSIKPDAAERMSLRLLVYYQGLLVLIRHGYDKTTLHDTIKTEINAITGDKNA